MTDIREVLDDIAQRADKAIRGEWKVWPTHPMCVDTGLRSDAEFVAAARTDVPKLVAALRAVLDLVESMPHDVSEEDCWYACAQAKDPYTGEWASCNDARRGKPCDCGRDAFVAKINRAATEALAS